MPLAELVRAIDTQVARILTPKPGTQILDKAAIAAMLKGPST